MHDHGSSSLGGANPKLSTLKVRIQAFAGFGQKEVAQEFRTKITCQLDAPGDLCARPGGVPNTKPKVGVLPAIIARRASRMKVSIIRGEL